MFFSPWLLLATAGLVALATVLAAAGLGYSGLLLWYLLGRPLLARYRHRRRFPRLPRAIARVHHGDSHVLAQAAER